MKNAGFFGSHASLPLTSSFLYRESQITDLAACLRPALKGVAPGHVLCVGPPSTGKTTVVRYVLKRLEEKDVARRGYVQALRNYWDYFYDLRGLTLYDWQKDVKLVEDFDELLVK